MMENKTKEKMVWTVVVHAQNNVVCAIVYSEYNLNIEIKFNP